MVCDGKIQATDISSNAINQSCFFPLRTISWKCEILNLRLYFCENGNSSNSHRTLKAQQEEYLSLAAKSIAKKPFQHRKKFSVNQTRCEQKQLLNSHQCCHPDPVQSLRQKRMSRSPGSSLSPSSHSSAAASLFFGTKSF